MHIIVSHLSLFSATGILLLGSGLLGTVVALRSGLEGFSSVLIGMIMSGFFFGYVLGSYLCPHIIRNFGHIRSFSVFAAIGCASVLLHALMIEPMIWLILRVFTGICMLGMYLVIESWLNSLSSNETRGRIFSIYMAINFLALGAGQFLLLIYDIQGMEHFLLIALFFTLSLVPIAMSKMAQPVQIPSGYLGLRRIYHASPLAVYGALISGIVSGAFWGMGSLYALSVGFDRSGIALFISSVVFGGALLQWPLGHLSDLHDRRKVIFFVSILASISALIVVAVIGQQKIIGILAAFVFGGCAFSIYALSMAHASDHSDPLQLLEINRGLLLLSGIGAALGPVSAGLLMEWIGTQMLMVYFACLMFLLAALALLRRIRGKAIATEEQADFVIMARSSSAMLDMDPRAESSEEESAVRS